MILKVEEPVPERHTPLLLQVVDYGIYSQKPSTDRWQTGFRLILFVKGASPIIRQLISAVAQECPSRKPDMLDENVVAKEAYS